MTSRHLDEELSEAVRQYTCLYDKSRKGHHDKNMVKNCWREIAEKVGIEDGEEAERLFTNFSKSFAICRHSSSVDSLKNSIYCLTYFCNNTTDSCAPDTKTKT